MEMAASEEFEWSGHAEQIAAEDLPSSSVARG
jgi:hypothetical protein